MSWSEWKFGTGGDRYFPWRPSKRGYSDLPVCDGWPEIGSCGRFARKGSHYCAECNEARRAHRGSTARTEDGDEEATDD